jgi:PKD repeat protein
MKKFYSISFSFLFFSIAYSQQPIQLDSTNMPFAGWTQKTARDTLPLPAVNFGQKGANRIYDFSNLVLFDTDTIEYRALTNAQKTKFPTSNIATTSNGASFLFSKTTSSQLTWQGIDGELLPGLVTDVTFSPEPVIAKFPTQYGSTYSGNWGFTKTVPGSAVGQSGVNQIRLTYTAKYTDTIDGWGKVITPFATYKCLRDQRYETNNTKVEIAIIGNLFTPLSNKFDTTKRYTYLTKETRGSALTFNYDTSGNLTQVTWSLEPPNKPIAAFTYSVAANGVVTFTDQSDNYPNAWNWNFGDAATSSAQNPAHTYSSNGNYYVCLTASNAGGNNTFCDTVRVSTIGAANQKPIAINDTASLHQPDSITINVLVNDSDPDQNALTVSIIKNPNNGVAKVSANKIVYQANSGFLGWDTLQYQICDNGSPSLCDSALVFIEIKEQIVLPQAAFSTSLDNGNCGAVFANNSTNSDSVIWKLKAVAGITDTTLKADTLKIQPNSFAWLAEVCLYAYNKFGVDSFCQQVANSCVGIEEVEDVYYQIFPNPSNKYFYLKNNLPFLMGVNNVRLTDLGGRMLKEIAVNENNAFAIIEIGDLSPGSYIAEVVLINHKIGGRIKVLIQ